MLILPLIEYGITAGLSYSVVRETAVQQFQNNTIPETADRRPTHRILISPTHTPRDGVYIAGAGRAFAASKRTIFYNTKEVESSHASSK